jgi:hypothetical protein
VADPLDGATVTGVAAVGVVVVDAPEVAAVALLAVVDFELDEVAVDWPAVVVAALVAELVLLPPAWAASPAKTPVPVSAPASDQRVSFLIRCRPASRSFRLLAFVAGRFMTSMVAHRHKAQLRSR